MTDVESTAELDEEILRGIEGVEAVDSSSSGLLPFDPRRKGPKDVLRDSRAWVSKRRYWVAGALVGLAIVLYFVDVPVGLESVPPWGWVSLLAGVVVLPFGVTAGIRTGKLLNPSTGNLLSVLNGKDGQQELLRIDDERHRDLTVLDYQQKERPRDYLKKTSVNGEEALEVDVYYPRLNVAVASWQAGATNHEIRKHEHAVERIKTEQERKAQEGRQAKMEKPIEVADEVAKHSNVLVGAVENVLTPDEVDLSQIRADHDADRMDPDEDHLAEIEAGLVGGREQSNGHDDEVDRVEEIKGQALETIGGLVDKIPGRGGGDS